jgi:hypothetical protein
VENHSIYIIIYIYCIFQYILGNNENSSIKLAIFQPHKDGESFQDLVLMMHRGSSSSF